MRRLDSPCCIPLTRLKSLRRGRPLQLATELGIDALRVLAMVLVMGALQQAIPILWALISIWPCFIGLPLVAAIAITTFWGGCHACGSITQAPCLCRGHVSACKLLSGQCTIEGG